jgi:hypothetical protein
MVHVMNRAGALLLAAVLIVGCGWSTVDSTGVMCDVASTLRSAHDLTLQAFGTWGNDSRLGPRQLAGQAQLMAQAAHDRLQTIREDGVRRGATWQALLGTYLHVGQAINALLVGDDRGGAVELVSATRELEIAGKGLPASCFDVDASPGGGA